METCAHGNRIGACDYCRMDGELEAHLAPPAASAADHAQAKYWAEVTILRPRLDVPDPPTEKDRNLARCYLALTAQHTAPQQDVLFVLNKTITDANARIAALEAALLKLADAADVVGVEFFDTDTMHGEVSAMQQATEEARALLKAGEG